MTSDVLSFFEGFIAVLFRLFTSWHIPGTNVTPAMWFVFLLSVVVLFRFLKKLGFGSANIDDVTKAGKFGTED